MTNDPKFTGPLLDSYALSLGLVRTPGEADDEFRVRVTNYISSIIFPARPSRTLEDQMWADIFGWD